jgi:hypothetical protein
MHMKNIQIRYHTHPVRQFEGNVVLDFEIDSQFQIGLDLHLGVCISLAL